jgi:hypothetical protein
MSQDVAVDHGRRDGAIDQESLISEISCPDLERRAKEVRTRANAVEAALARVLVDHHAINPTTRREAAQSFRRHLLHARPVIGAAQPLPAVDDQRFAGDVRGVVGQQVGRGVGHLFERGEAA